MLSFFDSFDQNARAYALKLCVEAKAQSPIYFFQRMTAGVEKLVDCMFAAITTGTILTFSSDTEEYYFYFNSSNG